MPSAAHSVKQSKILNDAILQHGSETKKNRLLERSFAMLFRGLVYPQIWEDPVVDMEALAITPDCHIVTIASGGCNALSYLRDNPAKITAVDLNAAHIALNRLKNVAAQHLGSHDEFFQFFGQADNKANLELYKAKIKPHLEEDSRKYWEKRDKKGQKRIKGFANGFYRRGLLGNFIGLTHFLGKASGVDPAILLQAQSREEQIKLFDDYIGPLFDRKIIRLLTSNPASLFGLGIPPAQYRALAGDKHMADVLRERCRKLACDFDLKDNYFAQQAFGRSYQSAEQGSVPPYLEQANWEWVSARANRIDIRHQNYIEFLKEQNAASLDRYILLDAQDWMTDGQLNALWSEINRTARPGARVLFRTAAEPSLLPGRVEAEILDRWDYAEAESLDYTRRDRSAIYGGVHLYRLKSA
jgi:S-adenosylmethionine-diacylglycerol 3-amino-3-carboxypropyl transferase